MSVFNYRMSNSDQTATASWWYLISTDFERLSVTLGKKYFETYITWSILSRGGNVYNRIAATRNEFIESVYSDLSDEKSFINYSTTLLKNVSLL